MTREIKVGDLVYYINGEGKKRYVIAQKITSAEVKGNFADTMEKAREIAHKRIEGSMYIEKFKFVEVSNWRAELE